MRKQVILLTAVFLATGFLPFYGCKKSTDSNCDPAVSRGTLFTEVRSLVSSQCGGSNCHLNGQSAGSHNFDEDCHIADHWDDIQSECNSNRMPPASPLSSSEKAIINDWVAAGHGLGN